MFDESTTLKRSDSMKRRTIITASEMDEEMYFLCSTMDENTVNIFDVMFELNKYTFLTCLMII